MTKINARSSRKASGGKYRNTLSKRKHMKASPAALTKIGPDRRKTVRAQGGNTKQLLLTATKVNVLDPATGKAAAAEMKNVVDNTASKHFIRRNILTKGAVIETTKGKAKITSRPAQHGTVNAVLIKE